MNPQALINQLIEGDKEATPEKQLEETKQQANINWLNDITTQEKIKKLQVEINNSVANLCVAALEPRFTDTQIRLFAIKVAVMRDYYHTLINP